MGIFEPHVHTYIAALPGMWERTICCSSLSKTYSITGWRLGYIACNETLMNECKKVHDFLTVCAPSPLQEAVIPALELPQSYYDAFAAEYTEKKDILVNGLNEIGIRFSEPQGSYFMMIDISDFAHGRNDVAFCEDLVRKVGVAAVPGSSFFKEPVDHLARVHFSKKNETLYDAIERLRGIKDMY